MMVDFILSTDAEASEDKVIGELKLFCKNKLKKDAAKELGISPQYLNDILKGHRPMPEKVANQIGWKSVLLWMPCRIQPAPDLSAENV